MKIEIPESVMVTIHGLISRGIQAVEVSEAGHLIFTLTDGEKIDLGDIRGPAGPRGEAGPQGLKGDAGPQGPQGVQGPKGAPGQKGDTGAKGETGARGPQGLKGDTGPKGDTGSGFVVKGYYETAPALQTAVKNPAVGDAYGVGASEPYDIYIYDGVTHTWINNGPLQGAKGDTGPRGPQGPQGPQGAQGPQGIQGLKGDTGAKGETGTTFTPAVSGDGVMSWTNDGGKANPASVNIKGPKGDTGAKGATGAKGDKGDTGAKGADGKTPVKGTDYWTAADRTSMVNDVLAAMPKWNGGSY